jgi:hypothetical protein
MLKCVKIFFGLFVVCVLVMPLEVKAQASPKLDSCPVIAKLPADLKDTEPPDYRLWFELRQCSGGPVVVNGYERHQSEPSLTFNTGYGYPVQLVHIVNVLVLESLGGSANHAFVFTFHQGKPSVALNRSTAGGMVVKQSENSVTVTVPVKTYPGPKGKFPNVPDASYSYPLEY